MNNDGNKWKTDFPFSNDIDDYVTRRDFIRFLTVVSGGFVVGNATIVASSLESETAKNYSALEICDTNALKNGEWLVFNYPDASTPAILIKNEAGNYLAFSQKCPHLACPVAYHRSSSEEPEHIGCHCHNGKFNCDTGVGTAGPPKELRPLSQIELKIVENKIIATGFKQRKSLNA